MKKVLTKDEIKFCQIEGWDFIPKCRERYGLTNQFDTKELAEKAIKRKVAAIREKIAEKLDFNSTYDKKLKSYVHKDPDSGEQVLGKLTIADVIRENEIREKKARLNERKLQKEHEKKTNFISSLSALCGRSLDKEIERGLRLGISCPFNKVEVGKKNDLYINEWTVWVEYTKSKSYPQTRRDLNITLKKGWFIKTIGGVVTFINGKIDRNGIACEWVEQGRSIADLSIRKGYLVKGEHIEAKSLVAAQKINADHRAKALAVLVAKRKRDIKKIKELKNVLVTFDMSLNSGNCKAGTQSFVNRLEAELGHQVTELSAYWVLFYGRKFGVEYYAQRAVDYAIAMNKKE